MQNEVIDKTGAAINRDEFRVYSIGDLIDGNYNRAGDILNLEYAEEWFDGVVIGNHEFAFMGGHEITGRRKHDRKTLQMLLNLVDKGVYAPSFLVGDYLLIHGGFSDKFEFESAADANEYIKVMWSLSTDLDDDVAIFDWQGKGRATYGGDPAGGIFELDWVEKRNENFNQVVGHSTYYTGPIIREYEDVKHYNVDVGGKTGKCVGGIVYDDVTGEVDVSFWGERYAEGFTKFKKTTPPAGDIMTFTPPKKEVVTTGVGSVTPTTPLQITTGKDSHTKLLTNMDGFIDLPLVSLDDLDIAVIEDQEILDVYIDEIQKGNCELKLRDFFPSGDLQ